MNSQAMSSINPNYVLFNIIALALATHVKVWNWKISFGIRHIADTYNLVSMDSNIIVTVMT